jgi:hypothetical protein
MKCNAIIAISTVTLLAACGGGSSGTSNNPTSPNTPRPVIISEDNPTTTFTTVKVFTDQAGVARGVSSDGVQGYVIVPDVALTVSTANSLTGGDLANVQVSEFPILQVLNSNANLRQGALTVEGVVLNVTAIEDLGGEAVAFFMEVPGETNALVVNGTEPTNIPTGTFQYQGTMGTALRNPNNPLPQLGTFTLNANFSNSSFTVNGSTLSDTISGSGVLNNTSGTLNSNNLSMVTSGTNRTATLYGQFHGNAAGSVSGAFHSNEANPIFGGFIVGSR